MPEVFVNKCLVTPEALQNELVRKGLESLSGVSPPLLLTYPMKDLEGDYVTPDGGIWDERPYVNFDHMHPIGVSEGKVKLFKANIDGSTYRMPIGRTRYFEKASDLNGVDRSIRGKKGAQYDISDCLQLAEQVQVLVDRKVCPGVSMEFVPLDSVPIGPSAMRGYGKSAYHHKAWIGKGWAHAMVPINPGAQAMIEDVAMPVIKSRQWHPVLMKSLKALEGPRKVWSNGVKLKSEFLEDITTNMATVNKAAGYDPQDFDPAYKEDNATVSETPPAEDAPVVGGDSPANPEEDNQPKGAVKHMLEHAQMGMDRLMSLMTMMKESDNPKVRKQVSMWCKNAEAMESKLVKMAESLHAELSGSMNGDNDGDEDMPDAGADMAQDKDADPEATEAPSDGDEEGMEEDEKKSKEAEDGDDEVDMDETGRLTPKSFPMFNPARKIPQMKTSQLVEFAKLVSTKSVKPITDEKNVAELKSRLEKTEAELDETRNDLSRATRMLERLENEGKL